MLIISMVSSHPDFGPDSDFFLAPPLPVLKMEGCHFGVIFFPDPGSASICPIFPLGPNSVLVPPPPILKDRVIYLKMSLE